MKLSSSHNIVIILLIVMIFAAGRLGEFFTNPQFFIVFFGSLIVALTIHEFAHALAADKLGDPNPRISGRVSLNPLKHLDLMGTLMIVFVGFGWGKPVQFDPYNLKDPAKDGALIAAAGPLANLILATLLAIVLYFFNLPAMLISIFLSLFNINLSLGLFNLIPLYPLDGHHILRSFFPPATRAAYDLFNRNFGLIALLVCLVIPIGDATIVDRIMHPALDFVSNFLVPLES